MAVPCFDGLFLPKQESEFVHTVLDELAAYQQEDKRKSVLLFPPLPSRLRYLIHRTTEDLPGLASFSVGESCCRRVVVYYSELRGEVEEDSDLESNNSLCDESPRPRSRRVMERVAKPAMTPEDNGKKEEEEEDLQTADTADITEEITAHLKQTEIVSIEHAHNDYSGFENVWICPDEFGHVIEIYGFSTIFNTDDLLDAFTDYSDGGMKIQWVDNTHALGVFSSESSALHALSIRHPLLKTRALCKGSRQAKGKAMREAEFIQPVKQRPRIDCTVARRMMTRALGGREDKANDTEEDRCRNSLG
ncbi:R3H and coiled-coil domain-containing protein 1-like [Diretmus argenteus]